MTAGGLHFHGRPLSLVRPLSFRYVLVAWIPKACGYATAITVGVVQEGCFVWLACYLVPVAPYRVGTGAWARLAFSLAVLMAPFWVVLRCTWGCST